MLPVKRNQRRAACSDDRKCSRITFGTRYGHATIAHILVLCRKSKLCRLCYDRVNVSVRVVIIMLHPRLKCTCCAVVQRFVCVISTFRHAMNIKYAVK